MSEKVKLSKLYSTKMEQFFWNKCEYINNLVTFATGSTKQKKVPCADFKITTMLSRNILRKISFLFIFTLLLSENSFSQCFQIESILVDACEGAPNTEGLNEMVRLKVGNTAINTSNMSVNFPSNTWGGLIQNTITASKVPN